MLNIALDKQDLLYLTQKGSGKNIEERFCEPENMSKHRAAIFLYNDPSTFFGKMIKNAN